MTVHVRMHVWCGVKVTKTYVLPDMQLSTCSFSVLSALLAFVDPTEPWFPFHLKGGFSFSFAQTPNAGGTKGSVLNPLPFSVYIFSLDELIHSRGSKCH